MFLSVSDRTARREGPIETVLVGSLAAAGIGGCIRLLLRGATRSVEAETCGSPAPKPEDDGNLPDEPFWETLGCRLVRAFSFQRPLIPLMNGLGQKMRLATHLDGCAFSCLAATLVPSSDEDLVYPNWGKVSSTQRKSAQRRYSVVRLT